MSRWLKREITAICITVVRCLDTSVSRAMGCFFDCFRVRPDRSSRSKPPPPLSPSPPPPPSIKKSEEPKESRNRLSSLFLSEENENEKNQGRYDNDRVDFGLGSPHSIKELRDEAKFLKACGTLPRTPIEIRKVSEKFKDSEPSDSEYHSWLPNTNVEKLDFQFEKEIDQTPRFGRVSVSSDDLTPSSCISNVQSIRINSVSSNRDGEAAFKFQADETDKFTTSVWPCLSAADFQGRNKSVRFECDFDTASSKGSSSANSYQVPRISESPGDLSASKPSPKPTPLKLSDEMQTPGTVFPANFEIMANRKTRIRSQYVYSVSNPVENATQWKELQEGNSSQLSGELQEFSTQSENATPKPEVGEKGTSCEKDSNLEGSLSAWLKPPSSAHDGNNLNPGNISTGKPPFGRTPGDRPIIGTVAAHWNENDLSHISPKWWDGNGIPNSTNKYKEDQKVSWHATPFEERLEKALSDETIVSQRKQINSGPIDFDEYEESDTAVSQLQPSMHSKSVVSF
ncbi:hypothetical protein Tsubulata_008291 [Turnera subulata]|uniref:Protein JASON n=1 Tax=Turnera subulata TaxID=218843 RepID=A0A9Q0FXD8_9ROSI|nr:hypothetical protein Tsubulata_008291 [Turnera subulata]